MLNLGKRLEDVEKMYSEDLIRDVIYPQLLALINWLSTIKFCTGGHLLNTF